MLQVKQMQWFWAPLDMLGTRTNDQCAPPFKSGRRVVDLYFCTKVPLTICQDKIYPARGP